MSAIFTGGLLRAAVLAAFFAYGQLKAQGDTAKLARVYALVDRCSDAEFIATMSESLRLMSLGPTTGPARWKSRRFAATQPKVLSVLNFFEEVASEYLDGFLDQDLADRNVAYIAVTVARQSAWFIAWMRQTSGEQQAWEQLQRLSEAWDDRLALRHVPIWRRPDAFFESPHI